MRLLVCGSREWIDFDLISTVILSFKPDLIIEGEAKGADKFARYLADLRRIPVIKYPAQWEMYGKSAGHIRNEHMLLHGQPDVVLAFHDDLENSKGTKNMVSIAKRAQLPVYLATHKKPIPQNISGIPRLHPEVIHCKGAGVSADIVHIGRPTIWGNPNKVGMPWSRLDAILEYGLYLANRPNLISRLPELQGKMLSCWCRPHLCHGDMIEEFLKGHMSVDSVRGARK